LSHPLRHRKVKFTGDSAFKLIVSVLLCLFFLASPPTVGKDSGLIEAVSVSPDGKQLALEFTHGGASSIYRVAVDTGNAMPFTVAKAGDETSPAFSPDGRRIAFTYWPGNNTASRICTANIDGSEPQWWPPSNENSFWPVFSPDNKTIVFARSSYLGSYSPMAQSHRHGWSFYAADLDGSNVRQLTNQRFYAASPPSLSPDGKSMMVMTIGFETPPRIAIYSLEHPGEPAQSLTPRVPGHPSEYPGYDWPNYMPDGKSILFIAASNGGFLGLGRYNYDVYRLDLETSAVERLTKGMRNITSLKVFPNGKTAVFIQQHENLFGTAVRGQIYLLDIQTHNLTPLRVIGLN
jgi:Tol biopolymer transport system component